jgi:hypothetical protein
LFHPDDRSCFWNDPAAKARPPITMARASPRRAMPFLPGFLLLIVMPTFSIVAFCVYLERTQRDFEERHPGQRFGIEEFRAQLSLAATCAWITLVAVVVLAFLALRLHDVVA